ncbi:MAG: helix-turn-helix transcriptional regulator [Lachnospiraceae bacterium]|nr:helix-turn-helix transcriptional regulator [Lachnospiraceae bacterium]
MNLNENIKQLRLARNISQVDLAKTLGVSKQSVSNWENNYIQPSIDMLIRLSKYFKVSTDFLLVLNECKYIEISGLTDTQISHVSAIIEDIQNSNSVDHS